MKKSERDVLRALANQGYDYVVKIDGWLYPINAGDWLPFKYLFKDVPNGAIMNLRGLVMGNEYPIKKWDDERHKKSELELAERMVREREARDVYEQTERQD